MAEAKRGILSAKFTGTRGLIDALDDPTLFKKRYIGNIQANIESFEDKGADPSTLTLFESTTTFTEELAAAKGLSAADWVAFVRDFRVSPIARLPFVADWVRARRSRQEVTGRTGIQGTDVPKKSKNKRRSPRRSRRSEGGGTSLRSMRG